MVSSWIIKGIKGYLRILVNKLRVNQLYVYIYKNLGVDAEISLACFSGRK